MLIVPFRMYFVKKRVEWDHVDAHSLEPAAGCNTGQNRDHRKYIFLHLLVLNVPHQQYLSRLLGGIMWL